MSKHAVVSIVDARSFTDGLTMMKLICENNDCETYLCGDLRKVKQEELELCQDLANINLIDTSKDVYISESVNRIKPLIKYRQIQNQEVLIPFLLSKIEADYITVISPYTLVLGEFNFENYASDITSALAEEYHGVREDEVSNAYLKQVTCLPEIKLNLNYFTYNASKHQEINLAEQFINQIKLLNEEFNLRLTIEEVLAFTFASLNLEISFLPFATYQHLASNLSEVPSLIKNNSGLQLTKLFTNQNIISQSKLADLVNLELIYVYYEQLMTFANEQLKSIIESNNEQMKEIIILRNQQIQNNLGRENEKSIISN